MGNWGIELKIEKPVSYRSTQPRFDNNMPLTPSQCNVMNATFPPLIPEYSPTPIGPSLRISRTCTDVSYDLERVEKTIVSYLIS